MPPSAGACHTTEADDSPDCGRAPLRSSIITAIGCRAATVAVTGRPVSGAGTGAVVGTGVGVGTAGGVGVAVGTEVGVDAGAVVAAGWLACAIGEAVGVAACPAIDVPIIATIATPTAI